MGIGACAFELSRRTLGAGSRRGAEDLGQVLENSHHLTPNDG